MLMYHPAYDTNHCLYRMLLILEHSPRPHFDWDMFRLLDFYILFPHLLKSIKPFPAPLRTFKKVINKIPDAYESLPNTKRVLFHLEGIQDAAVHSLIAKDIIDVEKFRTKIVYRTEKRLPLTLAESIKHDDLVNQEWFRVVTNELPCVDLLGEGGLKARAGLMEFKYDVQI